MRVTYSIQDNEGNILGTWEASTRSINPCFGDVIVVKGKSFRIVGGLSLDTHKENQTILVDIMP